MSRTSNRYYAVFGVGLCIVWYLFTHVFFKTPQPVEESPVKTSGRWRTINKAVTDESFKRQVDKLATLPYLQGYKEAPSEQGITVYDTGLAYDGLNFYNSGHAAEAGIMDMEGNILHKWTCDIERIWQTDREREETTHFRRAYLYENGDIVAIYDHIGMVKLDKDSNLVWSLKARTHHHIQVGEDGNIYVLTGKEKIIPRIHKEKKVLEEFITVLTPDGKILKEHSLLESFEK